MQLGEGIAISTLMPFLSRHTRRLGADSVNPHRATYKKLTR